MLARVSKAYANWLCAWGKQAKVMFWNFGIKRPTHLWYGVNLVSRACHFPSIYDMINKESPKTHKSYVPNSRVTCNPTMHASYSVTLFGNWNSTWPKYWFAGPSGILGLLPLHFQWYWQLHRNKASNATILHCLVLALSRRHPYLRKGILRNLDRLALIH